MANLTNGNGAAQNMARPSDSISRQSETLFRLYPNPATDEARVVYVADKSDRCRIRICNMLGQCLVEQTLSADESETRLSLKALPKGVYMVEYRTNSRLTAVQKLVKQ
jgi:hypothetical protein